MASRASTRIHHFSGRIGNHISSTIFFPLKMMSLQDNIKSFMRLNGQPQHETCISFKNMVLECPTHGLPDNVPEVSMLWGLGLQILRI